MDSTDAGLPGGHAPSHWYDTWDRQSSQSFSSTTKGLRNAPGENNCFLNSAVQVRSQSKTITIFENLQAKSILRFVPIFMNVFAECL